MNKENQKEINEVLDLMEKQCVQKEFKQLIEEIKKLVNENIEKQYKLDKINKIAKKEKLENILKIIGE